MKSSRALVLFALLALPLAPARAQTDADVANAAAVVMQQLDAFRRGDFDTAYGFASEMIHGLFDRVSFERMVTLGYPEIARSTSAYVASGRMAPDGTLYLVMKIRGANGNAVEAVYEMVREGGSFRINGVVARPDGASASASASSRRSSSAASASSPNRTRS
jgi:hypothetical protein